MANLPGYTSYRSHFGHLWAPASYGTENRRKKSDCIQQHQKATCQVKAAWSLPAAPCRREPAGTHAARRWPQPAEFLQQ